jgi:hypothetical protein
MTYFGNLFENDRSSRVLSATFFKGKGYMYALRLAKNVFGYIFGGEIFSQTHPVTLLETQPGEVLEDVLGPEVLALRIKHAGEFTTKHRRVQILDGFERFLRVWTFFNCF